MTDSRFHKTHGGDFPNTGTCLITASYCRLYRKVIIFGKRDVYSENPMARWTAVFFLLFLGSWEGAARVKMGKSADCDDTLTKTERDWDESDTKPHTCPHGLAGSLPKKSTLLNAGKSNAEILDAFKKPATGAFPYPCPPSDGQVQKHFIRMSNLEDNGAEHICMNTSIAYKLPWPASGNHRPAWPMYGSYEYIPPQRYLHNLEHGAIVGLYNPCAKSAEIKKFRAAIACIVKRWAAIKTFRNDEDKKHRGVLRFVLSPEIKTPTCLPFVVMAWRNRLMMPSVEVSTIRTFIKKHYAEGPEANAYDGQYSIGLLHPSDSHELQKSCDLVT